MTEEEPWVEAMTAQAAEGMLLLKWWQCESVLWWLYVNVKDKDEASFWPIMLSDKRNMHIHGTHHQQRSTEVTALACDLS